MGHTPFYVHEMLSIEVLCLKDVLVGLHHAIVCKIYPNIGSKYLCSDKLKLVNIHQ